MNVFSTALDHLAEIVGESNLITSSDAIAAFRLDGQTPLAVAFPGTAEEVAELLYVASVVKLSVLLRGAGRHLYLGAPSGPIGLVLILSRLNQMIDYDPGDLTITTQAGISLAALQELVAAHGQMLPLDPPSPADATLGGITALNLAGPMRMSYGSPRDLVLGLRVALSNNSVIKTGGRTVKNVAGYDLSKLFIGSWGTIGAIVELTLRLTPLPEARTMMMAALNLSGASKLAAKVLASRLEVATLDFVNRIGLEKLGGGFPIEAGVGEWIAFLGMRGDESAIQRQKKEITAMCPAQYTCLDGRDAELIGQQLRDFTYPQAEEILLRINLPLSQIWTFAAAIEKEGWKIFIHAGDGIVYALAPKKEQELLKINLVAFRKLAANLGGFAILESGSIHLKKEFPVWDQAANVDLMHALKETYDPNRILGCRRFLPGL